MRASKCLNMNLIDRKEVQICSTIHLTFVQIIRPVKETNNRLFSKTTISVTCIWQQLNKIREKHEA